MPNLDYEGLRPPSPSPPWIERVGCLGILLFACSGLAIAFAAGAIVCTLNSNGANAAEFIGGFLLACCWFVGGAGTILAIVGMIYDDRRLAIRMMLLCIGITAIATILFVMAGPHRSGRGAPGGF